MIDSRRPAKINKICPSSNFLRWILTEISRFQKWGLWRHPSRWCHPWFLTSWCHYRGEWRYEPNFSEREILVNIWPKKMGRSCNFQLLYKNQASKRDSRTSKTILRPSWSSYFALQWSQSCGYFHDKWTFPIPLRTACGPKKYGKTLLYLKKSIRVTSQSDWAANSMRWEHSFKY